VALDAFLKIDGIPGESSDEAHKGWIEVLGYSLSITQPTDVATGAATGRCQFSALSIQKVVDKASTLLARAICGNQIIKEVKLELCRATAKKDKYLEYTLSNGRVNGIHAGKNPQVNGGLPIEAISFGFSRIAWTYFQTDQKTGKPKGELEHRHDLWVDH
jgi:type VI secretion system secreted protein Hcp